MKPANAIRRAIPLLAQHGAERAALRRAGLSEGDAVCAIRFIPLAVGRAVMLEGLGIALPDSYLLVKGDSREEKKLAGEIFFTEAMKLAAEFGVDLLAKVALLSPEVQAVNQALNAGARPEDVVISLPVVMWEEIDGAARPWWKFWR